MSDYMFMLESHLSSEQSRVVTEVQAAAAEANLNLFLTGGAMRDMLGGFPIRDLDFTVEGAAPKLAKSIAQRAGAVILASDEIRKSVELRFPSGVTAEIGMARQQRVLKPGAKPQITPASIHDDLRNRDFTINAIALSLNRASLGLLLDPTNGVSDLENRELRAISNTGLYDDPVRILRLLRFRVRFGFGVHARTQSQYENVRLAEVERHIPARALFGELRSIAEEPNAIDVIKLLQEEKLLGLFSPALAGAKVNLPGLQKLQKVRAAIPFGSGFHAENLGLFLAVLTEKLTPRERTALVQTTAMRPEEVEQWQKLEARAKKLEKDLVSAKVTRPSHIYKLLLAAPGELVLFLQLRSSQRMVHDRIRNFFNKYLPAAQEVSDQEVQASGATPGTPEFQKLRQEIVAARLDGRTRKIPPAPLATSVAATVSAGRSRAR
ncbi:MAG: hypothetical protein ACK5AZ_00470 [Bryobacteraceae bacterium]